MVHLRELAVWNSRWERKETEGNDPNVENMFAGGKLYEVAEVVKSILYFYSPIGYHKLQMCL